MKPKIKFFHPLQSKLQNALRAGGYHIATMWQLTGVNHCLTAYTVSTPPQIEMDGATPILKTPRIVYALFLNEPDPRTFVLGEIRQFDELRKVPLNIDSEDDMVFQLSLYGEEGEMFLDDTLSWNQASQRIRALMASNFTLERILMKAVHDHLNNRPPHY